MEMRDYVGKMVQEELEKRRPDVKVQVATRLDDEIKKEIKWRVEDIMASEFYAAVSNYIRNELDGMLAAWKLTINKQGFERKFQKIANEIVKERATSLAHIVLRDALACAEVKDNVRECVDSYISTAAASMRPGEDIE